MGIIILFLITFVTLFGIDINKMRNNEPVFFSTWGFDYFPPVNLDEEKIINSIENYVVVNGDDDNCKMIDRGNVYTFGFNSIFKCFSIRFYIFC